MLILPRQWGPEFGHEFYNLYISLSAWPCGFHEVKNVTLFTENAWRWTNRFEEHLSHSGDLKRLSDLLTYELWISLYV